MKDFVVTFDKQRKIDGRWRITKYYAIVNAEDKKMAQNIVDLACYNKACISHPFYPFHKHTVQYKSVSNPDKWYNLVGDKEQFQIMPYVYDKASQLFNI